MHLSQLLQRSPGDPVDPPKADVSSHEKVQLVTEENKENSGIKVALPIASYPALAELPSQQMQGDFYCIYFCLFCRI